MAHWIMKSEPEAYGWQDLVSEGEGMWDGVRAHAAAAHLRAMAVGDSALFYESGKAPAAVGLMLVSEAAFPDPTAPPGSKWVAVRVRPLRPLPEAVPLKAMRAEPALEGLVILRQSRLSVAPVSEAHWRQLLLMAGLEQEPRPAAPV